MKKDLSKVGTIKIYQSTIKLLKSQKKKTGVPVIKLVDEAVMEKFNKK